MSSQKVYIIKDPGQSATGKSRAGAAGQRASHGPDRVSHSSHRAKTSSWVSAIRAYALGPVSLVFWPCGKGSRAWAIAGAGSVLATAYLWVRWDAFMGALEPFDRGALLWVTLVAFVILLAATTWARAVATSDRAPWPQLLRSRWAVFVLGLFFPGLGLLIADRRWKAAFAVWCAGLLAAAAVITAHWRYLVAGGAGSEVRLMHQSIEGIIAVAAGCVVVGLLTWLALAFDGVRAVSPVTRSSSFANGLAVALLVTLVLFLATFRPIDIARDLESAAERLQHQGMRIIPLVLCEAATKLDPGTPAHLARTAALYDELGLSETANAKRDVLEKRATQFANAVGAELIPEAVHEPPIPSTDRPLNTIDGVPPHDLQWVEPVIGGYQPLGQ